MNENTRMNKYHKSNKYKILFSFLILIFLLIIAFITYFISVGTSKPIAKEHSNEKTVQHVISDKSSTSSSSKNKTSKKQSSESSSSSEQTSNSSSSNDENEDVNVGTGQTLQEFIQEKAASGSYYSYRYVHSNLPADTVISISGSEATVSDGQGE